MVDDTGPTGSSWLAFLRRGGSGLQRKCPQPATNSSLAAEKAAPAPLVWVNRPTWLGDSPGPADASRRVSLASMFRAQASERRAQGAQPQSSRPMSRAAVEAFLRLARNNCPRAKFRCGCCCCGNPARSPKPTRINCCRLRAVESWGFNTPWPPGQEMAAECNGRRRARTTKGDLQAAGRHSVGEWRAYSEPEMVEENPG